MIRLIIAVVVFAAAMWLGPLLVNNPGYVMIVFGGVTIEATVFKLLFVVALFAFVVWFGWWLLNQLFHLPRISFSFLRSRKERRARQALRTGLQAFARQDFATASSQLEIAHADDEWQEIVQTMAAYSAQLNGEAMKANQRAAALPADEPASWFVVADLLCRQQNATAALAYLEPKMQAQPKAANQDSGLGRLYFEVLRRCGQWQRLLELVPAATKQQWFSKPQWQTLRFDVYPYAIRGLMQQGQFDEQAAYWTQLAAKERKSAAVQLGRAWGLAEAGQVEQAETLLTTVLSLQELQLAWPVLRQIPLGRQVISLRKQLQHWLRDHANHGYLYAALAYCAWQEGDEAQTQLLWNKAMQYQPELAQLSLV